MSLTKVLLRPSATIDFNVSRRAALFAAGVRFAR